MTNFCQILLVQVRWFNEDVDFGDTGYYLPHKSCFCGLVGTTAKLVLFNREREKRE